MISTRLATQRFHLTISWEPALCRAGAQQWAKQADPGAPLPVRDLRPRESSRASNSCNYGPTRAPPKGSRSPL